MFKNFSLVRLLLTVCLSAGLLLTLLPGAVSAADSDPSSGYQNHALVKVPPVALDLLEEFQSYGFDVVRHYPDSSLEVVAVYDETKLLIERFHGEVLIENCEEYNRARIDPNKSMGGFHTYDEILTEADSLVSVYPDLALLDTIGHSLEGRPIVAMKISDNVTVDEDEPEVQLNGLIHAREVITYEILLYTVKQLLTFHDQYDIKNIIDNTEIWVIFVVNPDGFVYNELTNPDGGGMWRKNRRDNGDGSYGIDLNRNFGYGWGYNDIGSSTQGASEIYRGAGPFSEPEAQVMRDFYNAHDFCASIHYHSYGNFMNIPYNFFLTPVFIDECQQLPSTLTMCDIGFCSLTYGFFSTGGPNGTAYDWTYGDQTQRRKCFSYLIEAGDGFWPDLDDVPRLLTRFHSVNMYLLQIAAQLNDTPSRSVGTDLWAYDTAAAYYESDFVDTVSFANIDPVRSLTFNFNYSFGSTYTDWFEMTPIEEQLAPGDSIHIELRLSPQGIEGVDPELRVPASITLQVTDSLSLKTDTLVFSVYMRALDADLDNDGVIDPIDNCINIANPEQEDMYHDGIGDACDPICCIAGLRGDILADGSPGEISIDISDLVYLVSYMFQSGPEGGCPGEVDINGSGSGPDIADLVYLVTYMFQNGPAPAPCP